jgi:aspartyl/asparaginyl beta-hydroxylase (cupin superfamily)
VSARVDRLLAGQHAAVDASRVGPLRYGGAAFLRGLGDAPWYDAAALPGMAQLEAAWLDVRAELDAAADRVLAQPYLEPFDAARLAPLDGRDRVAEWSAVFLLRHGEPVEANASLFPTTMSLLAGTRPATGEALFSVLGPGARTPVHSSGCNLVLTCHLALRVPDRCGLRVAGEVRTWTEGRVLVFDDSFVHVAWNDSPEPRVVLLWDVWHPALADEETATLAGVLPRLFEGP